MSFPPDKGLPDGTGRVSPVRKKQEFVCLYEREDRSRCSDRATARSGSIAHIICPANEITSDVNAYIAPGVIKKLVGLKKWITEPPPNDCGCRGLSRGPKKRNTRQIEADAHLHARMRK